MYNLGLNKFFDDALREGHSFYGKGQAIFHWIHDELMGFVRSKDLERIQESKVTPQQLASIVCCMEKGIISGKIGKKVLALMWDRDDLCESIVEENSWGVIKDEKLIREMCRQVVDENPKEKEKYDNAPEYKKERLLKFFMGKIMAKSKGRVDPESTSDTMIEILNEK